ncbi:substrate-binding periplasmic protein [Candidatus Auribacterota bacterium]
MKQIKKNISYVLLFFCLISITLFLFILPNSFCFSQEKNSQKKKRIIRLATCNWEPYAGENLKNYGFGSEIVVQAFKRAGYKAEVYFMPWARVLKVVGEGRYDAMFSAYYSEERTKNYALSRPYAKSILGFYKRIGENIKFHSYIDLKPYKIGVVRSYVNTPEFDAVDFLDKEAADSDKMNLAKLLKGRIDLILIDRYVANYLIDTSLPKAIGKLEFMDPPLEVKPVHVGFSRKIDNYTELLADFNKSLEQMFSDGSVDFILKKHGFE